MIVNSLITDAKREAYAAALIDQAYTRAGAVVQAAAKYPYMQERVITVTDKEDQQWQFKVQAEDEVDGQSAGDLLSRKNNKTDRWSYARHWLSTLPAASLRAVADLLTAPLEPFVPQEQKVTVEKEAVFLHD